MVNINKNLVIYVFKDLVYFESIIYNTKNFVVNTFFVNSDLSISFWGSYVIAQNNYFSIIKYKENKK